MIATEFELTDKAFNEICRIIYARAGIKLDGRKKPMVYSRLARRLRQLKLTRFEDYLDTLKADDDADEWENFTNALTTNLTSFFREPHHFDALATMAPVWMASHGAITVWCSAASTGEEPYSIAMTLVESLGGFNAPVRIIASDLDTHVLEKASAGIYQQDRLEKLSIARKRQFFLRGKGANEGMARVRRELRQLIDFRQINLLDANWHLSGTFNAIFCRNVMIYFDKVTQRALLQRFSPLLKHDGRLFVGHSESLAHVSDIWESCGKTIYRHK